MYRYEDIRTVHLEISTLCNARCPMCLRNVSGGKTNPHLPLVELKLEEIKKIFPPGFLRQLKRLYLCGNYGDPMLGRDTLPAFAYFREANPQLRLEIFSNGSGRDADWWRKLAHLGVKAHFAIDGLADTHALYRRQTDFSLILANASAFIAAGGEAHWDYIVFRHNEHQVSEARALSEKLGFRSFRPKKTGRFFSNQRGQFKERQEVLDTAGNVEYFLETPIDKNFLNPSLAREKQLAEAHGSFERYLDQTPIHCKVAAEKSLYVSAEGYAFPCCWTAIQMYPWYQAPRTSQIWQVINELPGGLDSLNAKKYSLAEILAGPFFQTVLPGRWERPSLAVGKLRACAKTCGRDFDAFRDQFTTTTSVKAR